MSGRRTAGEGTVTHNTERGRWEARVTLGRDADGHQVRRKFTAKTRREVVARLHEARSALDSGQPIPDKRTTVDDWLTEWATTLPGTVAPATAVQYADVIRYYIVPAIGHRPPPPGHPLPRRRRRNAPRHGRGGPTEDETPNLEPITAEVYLSQHVVVDERGHNTRLAEVCVDMAGTFSPANTRRLAAVLVGLASEAETAGSVELRPDT